MNEAPAAVQPAQSPKQLGRLLAVWAATAVCAVCASVWSDGESRAQWLVCVLGVSALVSFALQLGSRQRQHFLPRITVSVAGSVLIVAVFEVCLLVF